MRAVRTLSGPRARVMRRGQPAWARPTESARADPIGLCPPYKCSTSRRKIPVEDLLAVPGDDPGLCQQLLVEALHVGDAMGRAGEVRVMRDRHDFRALGGLRIEAFEVCLRARVHLGGGM